MLDLKRYNTDIEKEWAFVRDMPEDENGLTNSLHGIPREEFEEKAIPEMINQEKGVDMPDWMVPQTILYLWDNNEIVGQFRIRHYLTEALKNGAGHIGYFVKKEYRGKGYGTEGLRLTLDVARDIVTEDEFYLRVNKDNQASLRVMQKNEGRIVGEDGGHFFVRITNPGKNRRIHLEEVNPDNWRITFQLLEEQKHYVANSAVLLARAYAYRNQHSRAFVMYADDTPIGMALYYDIEDYKAYDFSQFFIDSRYQGRGYGIKAAKMILDMMRADGRYDKVYLCYIDGNDAARCMYEKLGFKLTGEADEDEIIMVKELVE